MRTCPFCGAAIEENARFCLYCMRELEPKVTVAERRPSRKTIPLLLCGVAVIGFSFGMLGIFKFGIHGDVTGDTTHSSATATQPTSTEVLYTYRKAERGDGETLSYIPPDDAIVITGVKTVSSNGVYIIPESIDGKQVVAIHAPAFTDNPEISRAVTAIVIPSTVRYVQALSLSTCHNLADIYLCDDILIDQEALPAPSARKNTLTIHCAADCTDRNFWLYKNIAVSRYRAIYEEWDGVTDF